MAYRDVTIDADNTDKAPVGWDKVMLIDVEATPDALKEAYVTSLSVSRYKLSVMVASNNLTVALKNLDDSDPSATKPLYFNIGGSIRAVTGALSVTKNAGTNWCNSGATGLATQEIDYFAYLGYNATDGVTIGFSRIPFARVYSDFSTTSTNERYCAISTITNAAAGDSYVNIGRFAATLSAGAGYTWTVPAYTNANLIQHPIFTTRRLTFSPAWTNLTVGNGTQLAYYQISDVLRVHIDLLWGGTTSISGDPSHAHVMLPSYSFNTGAGSPAGLARLRDDSTATNYAGVVIVNATAVYFRVQNISATYVLQVVPTDVIPHTWTTSDVINLDYAWSLI